MRLAIPTLVLGLLAPAAGAQSLLHSFFGDSEYESLGWSVALVGDVDGDGLADLLVGALVDDVGGPASGSAFVFSGANGVLLHAIHGAPVDLLGIAVAAPGDVDLDGRADLLVGISNPLLGTTPGRARLYSGSDGSVLRTWTDPLPYFGMAVAGAGDANGDGIPDVVVGDPAGAPADGAFPGALVGPGAVWLFSGADGSVLATSAGAAFGDLYAYSVSGAGDLDGDGRPDFLVGSPLDDLVGVDAGRAFVFSGATGSLLVEHAPGTPGDAFGWSVAGPGDVDRDGVPDLLAGADDDDLNGLESGSAWVLSGANGSTLHVVTSHAGAEVGRAVARIGDVDLDGYADFVVGAHHDDSGALHAGAARLHSGRTGAVLHFFFLPNGFDSHFGFSLSGGADVDGDGWPDLAVGAPQDDTGSFRAGSAWIHSLVPKGLSHFGDGSPGCAGKHLLAGNSVPSVGNAGWEIRASRGPASSLGLMLVADAALDPGADPFGIDVVLLVDLLSATEVFAFDLPTDALGYGASAASIPATPSLAGKEYHAQALFAWGGACGLTTFGLSTSERLRIVVQP